MNSASNMPLAKVNDCIIYDVEFYRELNQLLNSMETYYNYHEGANLHCYEWYWNECDVSVNLVNLGSAVSIYINERLVSQFTMADTSKGNGITNTITIDCNSVYKTVENVHTDMLAFIDKWEIGV